MTIILQFMTLIRMLSLNKMLVEKWSPDVVVGFSNKHKLFNPTIVPCTITLYQWIDRDIMRTKNMDLLEKLFHKVKAKRSGSCPNKRILEKSIEECPKEIEERETFGHWEIDTVVGNKTKSDAVLLTLAEWETCFEVILKMIGKDAKSVDQAVQKLRERTGEKFSRLFKTITSDNGSEF